MWEFDLQVFILFREVNLALAQVLLFLISSLKLLVDIRKFRKLVVQILYFPFSKLFVLLNDFVGHQRGAYLRVH